MNESIRNFFNEHLLLAGATSPLHYSQLLNNIFGASLGIPILLLAILVVSLVALWWEHPLYGKNKGAAIYPLFGNLIQILYHEQVFHDWNTQLLKKTTNMTVRHLRPGNPACYVTANPKNVEYILKTNVANYPKGPETCDNLNDLLGRGIFSVDGELWKLQRKVAICEFSTRSLRNFMQQIVQVELDTRFMPLLSHSCRAGVVVDLQDLLSRFTFDTICKLAFGFDPEYLHISLPAVEFAHAFDAATKFSCHRFVTYPFIWKTQRALNVGGERKLRHAIHKIDELAMSVIHKRKQQMMQQQSQDVAENLANSTAADHHQVQQHHGQHQLDLLSRFLLLAIDESKRSSCSDVTDADSAKLPPDHQQQQSKPPSEAVFTDVFLRDIVISFVLAGRDTSSTGMSWFFWLLSRNRHVEDSIRAEIAQIVSSRNHHMHHDLANKKDSTDLYTTATTAVAAVAGGDQRQDKITTSIADGEKDGSPVVVADPCSIDMTSSPKFTYEELKNMHYLDAALTESMRLYPPVPFDTKVAMEEDTWPDGTHIPKDSMVAYAPYAMGRMEQLWGSDCLEFKPERWLDDNGVFQSQSPYKYAVFQAGQRVCLGKELAMLQMKLVAATLLSRFTISMSSNAATSQAAAADDDFKPTYEMSLTLPIKNGLPVRIHLAKSPEEDQGNTHRV
jgi:cytochrome P450